MVLAVQALCAATVREALMCGRCRSDHPFSLDTPSGVRRATVTGTPVAGSAEAREQPSPIDSLPPEEAHGARTLDAKT